jgi:hypothetical protein
MLRLEEKHTGVEAATTAKYTPAAYRKVCGDKGKQKVNKR